MTFTRVRRAALAAALACGAAGTMLAASPAMAQASQPAVAAKVVIVTCGGKGVMRPATYVIACADGNDSLKSLTWAFWNSKAGGSGKDLINNCKPSCVGGTFHSYPVNVALSQVKNWPHHPGMHFFAKMTLTYTKTVPRGLHRTRVIPLVP